MRNFKLTLPRKLFTQSGTSLVDLEKVFIELSGGSDSIQSNTPTEFSTAVPFNQLYQHLVTTAVAEDIEFIVDPNDRVAGAVTVVRLLADGVSTISFSGIKEVSTSAGYDNTEDILNTLVFFYDGFRYYVNIFQDKDAQPSDIVAPTLSSAAISNSVRDRIVLTYNEALNTGFVPAISSYSVPGRTVSSVTVQGSTVYVVVSTPFTYQQPVSISYTPGVVPIQDASNNMSIAFSSQAVTNNIAAPDLVAPVLSTATVENANPNKIVLTYGEDLNPAVVPATSDFTVSGGKTVSSVDIVDAVVTLTVNSAYANGNTITVSYVAGTNKLQDLSGNFAADLTTQAVTNNIIASSGNVVWTGLQNATDATGGFISSTGGSPGGGRGTTSIDASQQFEMKMYFPLNRGLTNAIVTYLSETTAQDYAWSGNVFILGVYQYEGAFYLPVGGYAATPLSTTGSPTSIKFVKSGNDILVQQSTDDTNYTTIQTVTGVLTGKTTTYIKSLFAVPSGANTIRVTYTV